MDPRYSAGNSPAPLLGTMGSPPGLRSPERTESITWRKLFLWYRPLHSGIVLGIGILLFVLVQFAEFSVIGIAAQLFIMNLILSLVFRMYLENRTPRVQFPMWDWNLELNRFFELILPNVNSAVIAVNHVICWTDWKVSVTVLAFTFMISVFSVAVDTLTMLFGIWICSFSIPVFWEPRPKHDSVKSPPRRPNSPLLRHQSPEIVPTPVMVQTSPIVGTRVVNVGSVGTFRSASPSFVESNIVKPSSPPHHINQSTQAATHSQITALPFGEGSCPLTGLPYVAGAVDDFQILTPSHMVLHADVVLQLGLSWSTKVLNVKYGKTFLFDVSNPGPPTSIENQLISSIRREVGKGSDDTVRIVVSGATQEYVLKVPPENIDRLLGIYDMILRVSGRGRQELPPPPSQLPPPHAPPPSRDVFSSLAVANARLESLSSRSPIYPAAY